MMKDGCTLGTSGESMKMVFSILLEGLKVTPIADKNLKFMQSTASFTLLYYF